MKRHYMPSCKAEEIKIRMSHRSKINSSNDFLMKIVDFPPNVNDLISLNFPESSIIWANEIDQRIDFLINEKLKSFFDVSSFIKKQWGKKEIKFIKVNSENDSDTESYRHYLCFGDDPDGNVKSESISFRIDQTWHDFDFQQFLDHGNSELFKIDDFCFIGSYYRPIE